MPTICEKLQIIRRLSHRVPSEALLRVHVDVIRAAADFDEETQTYPPVDIDDEEVLNSIVNYLPEFSRDEIRADIDGILMIIRVAMTYGINGEYNL